MVVYKYQIWDTAGQEKVFVVHIVVIICFEIKFTYSSYQNLLIDIERHLYTKSCIDQITCVCV